MAEPQRLKDEYIMEQEEFAYYSEVIRRLEQALGSWLLVEDCAALTLVLEQNVLVYDDGFVIGEGEYGEDLGVGTKTAAGLAHCFLARPKRFMRRISAIFIWNLAHSPRDVPELVKHKEQILRTILSAPGVRLKPAT